MLLVGAGGLGCGAAWTLAAAGVPRIGVVDDDVVDLSNLQRQILHTDQDLGISKLVSLTRNLQARFPAVEVISHEGWLTAASAEDLFRRYDLVLDGSDNLATKFLANDAAVMFDTPLIHAASVGTIGQLVTVPAGGKPCYRCLFEELPPPGSDAPSCAEAGVLGPVPGILGAMGAAEAIRLLSGRPAAFVGQLIRYDSASLTMRSVRYKPNDDCGVCGPNPRITRLEASTYRAEACRTA